MLFLNKMRNIIKHIPMLDSMFYRCDYFRPRECNDTDKFDYIHDWSMYPETVCLQISLNLALDYHMLLIDET